MPSARGGSSARSPPSNRTRGSERSRRFRCASRSGSWSAGVRSPMVSDIAPYKIALWGPSRAGKTALLAYLLHATARTPWDVRPTKESEGFVKSMTDRQRENRFPPPTAFEHADRVVYTLVNGPRRAMLSVEDRAGAKWIAFNQAEQAIL